jgi:hypothetical protein
MLGREKWKESSTGLQDLSPTVVSSSVVCLPCGQLSHLLGLHQADKLVPR